MSFEVVALPGDGIGPEIMAPALEVLQAVMPDNIEVEEYLFGGVSIDAYGEPLTDEALGVCQSADAVLLATVGGPKWDTTDPSKPRPEEGLLALRKGLGLYGNLRPIKPLPALYEASPLREERIRGTDLLIVRELTGGIYFGDKGQIGDKTYDCCEYTSEEVERIARLAFQHTRLKVTLVEYSNIPDTSDTLETSKLWRNTVNDIHNREFPNIPLEHMSTKEAVIQMGLAPSEFDVILAENMLGDILSDQAAMLTGSLGMLPSISVGNEGTPTLSEPGHGSAPDIVSRGVANPLAMFYSVAMMLRHGLKLEEEAVAIESAIDEAVSGGLRTTDLGGDATTRQAANAVLAKLQ